MNLQKIFLEFKSLPIGHIIQDPYLLIPTNFKFNISILDIIGSTGGKIYFTRLSLKHLAEKGDLGEYLFSKLEEILLYPDLIYNGNFENRFLISKKIFTGEKTKPHIITIEVTQDNTDIIVTSFVAKDKYFKNLKLLWGTTSSPSQQFPKE